MVTFFRKIRQKLLDEGHLKRYLIYALGEVLLVMVGILLALQVNNWNQSRLEAQEEARLLGALSSEMQLNRFRNTQGRNNQQEVLGAAERLLSVIHDSTERLSADQLDRDVLKLTGRWFGASSTSTYDILVGAGQLGLISSVDLRNELARLKVQMELLAKYETIQATFVDNQLKPFLNQSTDRLSVSRENPEMPDQLPVSRFTTSYDELLESRDFSNLLVDLIRHTMAVIPVYSRIDGMITRIDSMAVGSGQ